MKDIIIKEQQLHAPMKEVWSAISNGEEISVWFIKADFKPEVGYEYTFTRNETTISGKVLEANPHFNLVYTWIVDGTGVETKVRWKLEENEQGTLLTLEHSGISNYPTEDMATNMFTHFSGGWDACIEGLDKYLKKESVE